MTDFARRFDAFLAELFALHPVIATDIGEHTHDGSWPDLSETGRAALVAFTDRWLAEFGSMAELDAGDAVDRDLLIGELEELRFFETDLRDEAWDPLTWVYLMGGGLFPLIALAFAPLAVRLTSVAGRLDGIPGLLATAREILVGVDGRPVARFQTERAIADLPGIGSLIDEALAAADGAAGDPDVVAIRSALDAAATRARAALAAFEQHLREVVLPRSEGEGRLGPERFAAKMAHTMRDPALTPSHILATAEREYALVRAEMLRLARSLWPVTRPAEPVPADEEPLVRGVLDAIAAEHPAAEELIAYCQAELRRIEAFCVDRALIGLADEPLEIRWTPEFLRSHAGAMLSTPGPLDRGEKAFFSITPIPADWSAERRESYLREDNDRMLRLLTIHEAVPGHYLQMAAANRTSSLPRAVFKSGLFAEGWAVYVTQVMMDMGYGADDPALLLTHWKFYLRSITNAIIDIRIHTAGMTEQEAVTLMVDGGFQEEAEARSKYDRARLTSTQLCTYFVGSTAMWDLERDIRRRLAGDETIDHTGLPGGLGDTPGFVYREHLEAVIAHGAPPPSILRRILLG